MVMQGIRDAGVEILKHPIADHPVVKHAWVLWGSGGFGSWLMWFNGHLTLIQGWCALIATVAGAIGSIYAAVIKARMAKRMEMGGK